MYILIFDMKTRNFLANQKIHSCIDPGKEYLNVSQKMVIDVAGTSLGVYPGKPILGFTESLFARNENGPLYQHPNALARFQWTVHYCSLLSRW